MISVAEAQALCLAGLAPLGREDVALADAAGRTLLTPVQASRAQPPFPASAMDGYAVAAEGVAPGATYTVVGEAAAGHGWTGTLQPGQALRIFTGAPVPPGAGRIVIQEDVTRDGDMITLRDNLDASLYIRPEGADFPADFALDAPRILSAADVALLAAMNAPAVTVARKPSIALIATGDELVLPGGTPSPDQIIASNIFGLKALIDQTGGQATILPIARDTAASLRQTFAQALAHDLIVTIGGASVGDHDLVGQTAQDFGLERAFHKIAMRPGKPLMMGRLHGKPFLGLPGNPVSAMVCGHLFLLPMLRALLGQRDVLPRTVTARLIRALPANGLRAHYMRATLAEDATGRTVTAADRQDSALLTVLAQANALLIRPVGDPALPEGATVATIPL